MSATYSVAAGSYARHMKKTLGNSPARNRCKARKANPHVVPQDAEVAALAPKPRSERRVACTMSVLAIALLSDSKFRAMFKLEFDIFPESLVSGVVDVPGGTFEPEGSLAEAFDRYHHAEGPETLDGKARYEWWACHLVDCWVKRVLEAETLGRLAVWQAPESDTRPTNA